MGTSSNLLNRNRTRTVFLTAGAGVWLSVLVLSLIQYDRVRELRARVEAHVSLLTEADRVHLSVSSATKSVLQSRAETANLEAVQGWLADCRLAAETPLEEATISQSRQKTCEALEAWRRLFGSRQSHTEAAGLTDLSLAQLAVAEAFSDLVTQVRRQTGEISERLAGLWMVLNLLGVGLVGLTGTLGIFLFAARRRTEVLRKAKEAVEESELKLEKRVQQRTADLEASNQKLEQEVAERKQLEMEVLEIDRCERERIGADLHDGLAQHLVGVSLLQKSLENKLTSREVPEAEAASKIGRLISEAVQQSRALARGLASVGSTSKGLGPALESLAADAKILFGVPCQVRTNGSHRELDIEATNHLFRIAQEAVHNAAKHAGARQIVVELTDVNSELALKVTDDGVGIPDASADGPGIGLRLMKYRASLLDGTLRVQKEPEGGTTVVCRFPRQ